MNEGEQTFCISAQNTELVKEPVAGTNTDVNLVGSFTKIGGKDNQGLTDTDYIIGKDKFWLVSELKKMAIARAWASNRCVHTSIQPQHLRQEQPC